MPTRTQTAINFCSQHIEPLVIISRRQPNRPEHVLMRARRSREEPPNRCVIETTDHLIES